MNVLPYDPHIFQRLPDLSEAGATFDNLDGHKIVNEMLMPLFRKYGVEYTFGVSLAHRHFDLAEDERLVEYKDTSVPWKTSSGNMVPHCWIMDEGNVRPYEFRYGQDGDVDWSNDNVQEFLVAFQNHLENIGARGLFGLCVYPGNRFRGRVEMTKGRANINFDPDDAPKGVPVREAAWFFSQELFDDACKCFCSQNENGGHDHNGVHQSIGG